MAAEATAATEYVSSPQADTEQKIEEWRLLLLNNLRPGDYHCYLYKYYSYYICYYYYYFATIITTWLEV